MDSNRKLPAGGEVQKKKAELDEQLRFRGEEDYWLREHEVAATVHMPALFVRVRAERLLFAHAVSGDAVAGDTLLHESLLYGFSSAGA